jgi:hypothetical protein
VKEEITPSNELIIFSKTAIPISTLMKLRRLEKMNKGKP